MSRALGFAKGDLNPHNFLYPTFYFYVLFAWVGGWFALSWLTGAVSSLGAFQTQFFLDPSGVYHAGRMLGVACGVATVWLTWMLGARVAGWRAGACAALLLAVAPTAVRDAHYVKHDVPVTLAIVAAMVVLVRLARVGEAANAVVEPPSRATLAGAGAACGVAFSTHYYAIFLALPLALAVAARLGAFGRPPGSPRPSLAALATACVWAGLGAAVTFFALSPFLLVEPRTAWQDIVANRQIVVDRAGTLGSGPFPSAGAYLRLLWQEGLGWPGLGAAAIGLALVARRRPWQAVLLASFPLAFLLFLSHTVAASRYLNPVLPFLAVFAGRRPGAAGPLDAADRHPRRDAGAPGGLAQPPDRGVLRAGGHPDPRAGVDRGARAARLHDPRAALLGGADPVAREPRRGPHRHPGRSAAGVDQIRHPARPAALPGAGLSHDLPGRRRPRRRQDLRQPRRLHGRTRLVRDANGLEPLTRLGVQYVVLKRYNTEDPAAVPLRARLMAAAARVAVVSPYRAEASDADRARVAPFLHNTDTPWHPALERPGPGLEIWKLPR